jgi:glycosyltransferase involved in cell wall biosynthesis
MEKINIVAPIGYTGYGVVGRNLTYNLAKLGYNVSLFPIGDKIECSQVEQPLLLKSCDNRHNFDSRSPSLKIWHQNDLAMFPGSPRIAYTFFELDELKPEEVHHLKQCDKVIVACDWARRICLKYGIQANILPCGVSEVFHHVQYKPNPKCVFLNVGKWEVRKGHLELAKSFKQLLSETNNDVELWMMSENRFYRNGENEWWKNYYREHCGRNVKFINWVPQDSDVAEIMNKSNIGVFPSKAEAWNLELLEMMACGKQVICTDYSGHTEFANSQNSILLPIRGMETSIDACDVHPNGFWFNGFGKWATINVDDLTESMYRGYQRWLSDPNCRNFDGEDTADKYSWKNITNTLTEIIWKRN